MYFVTQGIQKYGVPRRIYFDNGSQYRTRWMKRAFGLLGIRLLYAKPRNPQGKGKQERFNRTVDSFISEMNPIKVHPKKFYSTFCGSRMFLFSASPFSRNL
jgi:transposase InsO family protein